MKKIRPIDYEPLIPNMDTQGVIDNHRKYNNTIIFDKPF